MSILGEAVIGFIALSGCVVIGYVLLAPKGVSDRHQHRWTEWKTVDEVKVYFYPDPDQGKDLPDRVDAVLRRQCVKCGLPETKTVRGLGPERKTA